jgi:DNA-binding transcriptional MerR regulator
MALQLPILGEQKKAKPSRRAATLRVGDLARRAGKTVRALRLYEEIGLLEPIERSKSGYRLYDAEAVTRVRWISKFQELGFSLSEIRDVARQWESGASAPGAMARVETLLRDKLAEAREQIERLQSLERELVASLDYLETCPTCDPRRIVEACSACDLHDEAQPELVAGFSAH